MTEARRKRRSLALLAVGVSIAAQSACGTPGTGIPDAKPSGETPQADSFSPKAPVPAGRPLDDDARVAEVPDVKDTDASAVAAAWARVAFSYDTAYDTSPHDAVLRAVGFYTEEKAAAERAYRPQAGAGHQWNEWEAHQAWTSVEPELHDDDVPPDTEGSAWRQVTVDGKAQGRDGWSGEGPQLHAYVHLVRTGKGQPWRIGDVNTVEAATPPSPQPSAPPTSRPE